MRRYKGLFFSCLTVVVVIVFLLIFGMRKSSSERTLFSDDGYILASVMNAVGASAPSTDGDRPVYFSKGSDYVMRAVGNVQFTDQKNSSVLVKESSFVHYNTGAIGSLCDGVVLNMDDVGKNAVNYYGLPSGTTIDAQGDHYILSNDGASISFSSFIWKISDCKYLIASKNIKITFSTGNVQEYKGYVELTYMDGGMIYIATQDGVRQSASSNCIAELDNHVDINLSNKILRKDGTPKLSLEQMVVHSDDNIQVVPKQQAAILAQVPRFDIQTIDGTNGTNGKSGNAGVEGAGGTAGDSGNIGSTGAPGTTGTTGKTGVTGANGSNGTAGAQGTDGINGGDLDTGNAANGGQIEMPSFQVSTIVPTASGVSGVITVTDGQQRLAADPYTLQIISNNTGNVVDTGTQASGQAAINFNYGGLMPNTQYRLTLEAQYMVDGVTYSKIFVDKVFVTNSLGITVNKLSASSDTLQFVIRTKDSDLRNAQLQLWDNTANKLADEVQTLDIGAAASSAGAVATFGNLDSNHQFSLKVIQIGIADPSIVVPDQPVPGTFWTLKKMPTIGTPLVTVNKRDSNFQIKLDNVSDPDGAVRRYRYELYEVDPNGNSISTTPAKVIYATDTGAVYCYIDNSAVFYNKTYKVKAVAECADNEKNLEVAGANVSVQFSMTGDAFPTIVFEQDTIRYDYISGTFRINTNGAKLSASAQNPMIIQYKSSTGKIINFTQESLPEPTATGNGYEYDISFSASGLKANDPYTFSIYGTVDLHDGIGPRTNCLIGNAVVSTSASKGFTANIRQGSDLTSPVSFTLQLNDSGAGSSSYEASGIQKVVINLYNGTESSIGTSAPIGTYTLTGTVDSDHHSTIGDQIYGSSIAIDAADFGISSASAISSNYTVEIKSVTDYTTYANAFTIDNNVKTFAKQAVLPTLNDIDVNNGLQVIPITLTNISNYVSGSQLITYMNAGYNGDTVLGYEVRAVQFDNSVSLVSSFDYYVYREYDYTAFMSANPNANASQFYTQVNAVTSKSAAVSSGVPSAVFLFASGDGQNMSRGNKYVFTYRAKLKDSSGTSTNLYFPDAQYPDVVIRSQTANAPYQAPKIYFYPLISNSNSVTWNYSVSAVDTAAVDQTGGFRLAPGSSGTLSSTAIQLNVTSPSPSLTINGLQSQKSYQVYMGVAQYQQGYSGGGYGTVTLVGDTFDGRSPITNASGLTYKLTPLDDQNRIRITVTDANQNGATLSRVVGVQVSLYQTHTAPLQTFTLPFDSVVGTVGTAYLSYGQIQQYFNSSLDYTVNVLYDSGVSGLNNIGSSGFALTTVNPQAGGSNYLALNSTQDGLMELENGSSGSYFTSSAKNVTSTGASYTISSPLYSGFSGQALNLTFDQTGAHLEGINGRPSVTAKRVDTAGIYNSSMQQYTTLMISGMTPTINLNNGDAYTITVYPTAADLNWVLQGHAPLVASNAIQDNQMYYTLYIENANGTLSPVQTKVPAATISADRDSYTTHIAGLTAGTTYAVQFFYYYANNPTVAVYPVNAHAPDVVPANNYYVFTTSAQVVVTPGPTVTYSAVTYNSKSLRFSYGLNVTTGFAIQYSLVKKSGSGYTTLLTSGDLTSMGVISTPNVYNKTMNEQLDIDPGRLKWEENGKTVYFPFNSTDYYLCISPVTLGGTAAPIGDPAYLCLNVPALQEPFYNVKSTPGQNSTVFNVSVVDAKKIVAYSRYRVRVFDAGNNKIFDSTYSVDTSAPAITVSNVTSSGVTLKIYAVYDSGNDKVDNSGNPLADISSLDDSQLDSYLRYSTVGYPLSNTYSLGDVQAAMKSANMAALYFSNSVNLAATVKSISYVVVDDSGNVSSYSEDFVPVINGTVITDDLTGCQFTKSGTYQIQVRFYNTNGQALNDDRTLTLIKNY